MGRGRGPCVNERSEGNWGFWVDFASGDVMKPSLHEFQANSFLWGDPLWNCLHTRAALQSVINYTSSTSLMLKNALKMNF